MDSEGQQEQQRSLLLRESAGIVSEVELIANDVPDDQDLDVAVVAKELLDDHYSKCEGKEEEVVACCLLCTGSF
eukprot:13569265-Ditylum_brightwellii.AAC.1